MFHPKQKISNVDLAKGVDYDFPTWKKVGIKK
jgi:hypothetical protein